MSDSRLAHARPPHLTGRFVFLDALRGIAAMAVAMGHFIHPDLSPLRPVLVNEVLPRFVVVLLDNAYLGVEIFFVLSGFVIAHSIWDQRITPRYAGNFALRRSLRLDPPYWTMIAWGALAPFLVFPTWWAPLFEQWGGWRSVFFNAVYLHVIRGYTAWVGVAWTLCLEVQFYLAFLGLSALTQQLRRSRQTAPFAIVAFVVLAVASIAKWLRSNPNDANDFLGRWHMFFAGVLLYAVIAGVTRRRWLFAYLGVLLAGETLRREMHDVVVVLTCLAIFAAAKTGGLKTWLNWRPLQALGHRSYSFYLIHVPFGCTALTYVFRAGDGSRTNAITGYFAAILVSLIGAELLYRFVESPAVRLSAKLRPKSEAIERGVRPNELATGHVDRPPCDPEGA